MRRRWAAATFAALCVVILTVMRVNGKKRSSGFGYRLPLQPFLRRQKSSAVADAVVVIPAED
jgi:hypothetical protein